MPETPFSFSHLESPPPGAILPPGRHLLRGWVWPKLGGLFVDVRARIGPKVFPGVHGVPRADLAGHFQTGRKFALAEFQVVVGLTPGPVEIVFEVLEIAGRWLEFQRAGFSVAPELPPVERAIPSGPLNWLDFCRGLQLFLREAGRQTDRSPAQLAGSLVAEIPYPRDLRHPPAPFVGFVDEPATVTCCRYGRIPAFGHLFHPEFRIRQVYGTVDLQVLQPLPYGLPSPGPAAHYTQFPHARDCGFVGLVDVPAQLPNPASLRIYAELEDESLHLCQVVRTRLHPVEEEKQPYPIYRPGAFDRAVQTWNDALAARGMVIQRGAELDRSLAALREEYERRAPRRSIANVPALVETQPRADSVPPGRIILATHGLSLQGAPRFLLEYGRCLAAAGSQLQVVSAEDGPLRAEFAAVGARVLILDTGDILAADTASAAQAALARLAGALDWSDTDLVIANSFTTFWAVHVAKAAGRPVLMYVHESTTPAAFFEQRVTSAAVTLAEEAFALADCVSFTTASTRRYHLGYGRPERHRLTPGWIDVPELDRWLARQDRTALRRRFGLHSDELLVCNIGTVSDRKGQHTFARAVDLFNRRQPELARRTRFVLLGGRHTPFDQMLGDVLAALALPNLAVHPETADYLPYYLAADVFACSSYEESSPRVIFEAMVCRTPIIASGVHGVPELVRPDCEALLLPAGDTVAWCEGLARMLSSSADRLDLAARARARVESHFNAALLLPRHTGLARAVADGTFEREPRAAPPVI